MARPNNVVIIMTDQHSPKMLGCYGHSQVKTPNLDSLALSGTRFSSAYSPSPLCVPARAALATGRYVHQIGCWDNAIAWNGHPKGWPQNLVNAGYKTISIGKLHYRSDEDPIGFNERIIPMHIAEGVGELSGSIRPDLPARTQGKKLANEVGPGETSYTAYDLNITEHAISWIKANNKCSSDHPNNESAPWVLYISFICPHFPLSAPQKFYDLYDVDQIKIPKPFDINYVNNHPWWSSFHKSILFDQYFTDDDHRRRAIANYYGLVSFADNNIGKIIKTLKETGLIETTNILYTSDHGDNLGARRIWGKGTMHEESAGIPMILSGPGVPKQKTVRTPVSLLDVYPTLLDAIGLPPNSEELELPGTSLIKLSTFKNSYDQNRNIISEYHAAGATSAVFMLRRGDWKYIHYTGYEPELFNLQDDPEELANLANNPKYATTLRYLSDALHKKLLPLTPNSIDTKAKFEQAAHIEKHGGRDFILGQSQIHGSPVPGGESTRVN